MDRPERRKNPRTPTPRLAFINLQPYDNGGVITDISPTGLRFHMVKPVEHGGVVRLSMLLGAANNLNAVGELVWLDPTRKIGGVRFTVLPDGAADQILDWAKASSSVDALKSASAWRAGKIETAPIPGQPFSSPSIPEPAGTTSNTAATQVAPTQAPAHAGPAQVTPTQSASSQAAANPNSVEVPLAASHVPPQPASPQAGPRIKMRPWTRLDESQPPDAMPWITHFDPDPPRRDGSFLRGVLGGVLLCALLGWGAWFAMRHHLLPDTFIEFSNPQTSNPAASSPTQPRADSLPSELPGNLSKANSLSPGQEQQEQSAPSPSPQPSSPPANQALESNPSVQPRSDSAPADPFPPKATPAPQTSARQLAPTPQAAITQSAPAAPPNAQKALPAASPQNVPKTNPFQPPPASSDTGESQLMLARQYLNGRVQPRNPTIASQLLWAAVEKGNSSAEMDLADLYLHGDGVARNCDQARVLLSAASEKGNPEAMEKLRELNRTGCR
jgi:PilZ domain-containing protein